MLKNIFIFIILTISQFILLNSAFSAELKFEEVFSDIDKNYKYYNELQTLYDRGIIFPDENGKFNPKRLLNRDEFVSIAMETSCKKCIKPNTDFSLIKKYYNTNTFYDVYGNNKYFYCIAEGDSLGYVKGYNEGYKCEGKETIEGKRPFCIDNRITLEEALAITLRTSGVFTVEDNKNIIKKIYSGEITKDLSDDVSTRINGNPYTFYGYLEKALNFELKEIDNNGNEKIYKLLEKTNNKIYPSKYISKEEFLKIAFIALKSNSCSYNEEPKKLFTQINILNKDCKIGNECTNKDIKNNKNIFDFSLTVGGICKKGIENKNYSWRFYNVNTRKEIIKEGKYIDDYKFLSKGKWKIFSTIIDNCGNTSTDSNTIFIVSLLDSEDGINRDDNNNPYDNKENIRLDLEIEREVNGSEIKLEGILEGGEGPYKYTWDYGDGTTGNGDKVTHKYTEDGTYITKLIVTDSNGLLGESIVTTIIGDGINKDDNNNPYDNKENIRLDLEIEREVNGNDIKLEGIVDGGEGPYKYTWDYGDGTTGNGDKVTHKYTEDGTYITKLIVTDSNGLLGESIVTTIIGDGINREDNNPEVNEEGEENNEGLIVQISTDIINLSSEINLGINFEGIVDGGEGPYEYTWDYGDGTTGNGEKVTHEYTEDSRYIIKLIITDSNGLIGESSITININDIDLSIIDSDNDGVMDDEDILPNIAGSQENNGAPILENKCSETNSCDKGYICEYNNSNDDEGICIQKKVSINKCLENGYNNFIVGNSVCNECPCAYSLDFISSIRKCDLIFPAITSLNTKNIYSRGKPYKIN